MRDELRLACKWYRYAKAYDHDGSKTGHLDSVVWERYVSFFVCLIDGDQLSGVQCTLQRIDILLLKALQAATSFFASLD